MNHDNPYQAPQALLQPERFTRGDIFQIIRLGVFVGGSLGAVTNAINAIIHTRLSLAFVFQGIIEGSIYGFGNSLIFVGIVNIWGKGIPSVSIVFREFLKIAGVIFCCWLLGGYLGWKHGLILSLREFPQHIFDFDPDRLSSGYAWVLGSIRLAVSCSPIATLFFALIFANSKNAPGNFD